MPFLHLVLNLYLRTKLTDEYATAVGKSIHCLQFDRGYSYIAVRKRKKAKSKQRQLLTVWVYGRLERRKERR